MTHPTCVQMPRVILGLGLLLIISSCRDRQPLKQRPRTQLRAPEVFFMPGYVLREGGEYKPIHFMFPESSDLGKAFRDKRMHHLGKLPQPKSGQWLSQDGDLLGLDISDTSAEESTEILRQFLNRVHTIDISSDLLCGQGVSRLISKRGDEPLFIRVAKSRPAGLSSCPIDYKGMDLFVEIAYYATDADLATLARWSTIRGIIITEGLITDAGLAKLGQVHSLERLAIEAPRITDSGLAHLKTLSNLRSLSIGYTPITDAGLAQLKPLTHLEELDLTHNRGITDQGMVHLKGLTKLRTLGIGRTRVGGSGLKHLTGLKALERLTISETVSCGGIQLLKQSLPQLQIIPRSKEKQCQ